MIEKLYRSLFILIAIILWSTPSSAGEFSSQNNWETLETKHFYIHYPEKIIDVAARLATIAEKFYPIIARKEKWEPFLKTDLVLTDNMDIANGYATVFPYNKVVIYVSRPAMEGVLHNFDDWLKEIFIHEYTHILNMDKATGINKALRYTMGRVAFPVALQPIWLTEGNAVKNESIFTGFGRNNSTYADMILRMDYLSGSEKSITEASYFTGRWPYGSVPYLYGGKFIEFLDDKHKDKKIADVIDEASDNFFPVAIFMINTNSNDVYKKDFPQLWNEWQIYQRDIYLKKLSEIKKLPLTKFRKITSDGVRTFLPRYSRKKGFHSKTIYYIKQSETDGYNLMAYKPFSKAYDRKIARVNQPSSLSISGNNLYMTDLEIFHNSSMISDIYKVSPRGETTPMSKELRAIYLDSDENGNILYVKQDSNKFSLVLKSKASERVIINRSDIQISHCRLDNSGERALFVYKLPDGKTGIALLDMASKSFKSIVEDIHNNIYPAWHPGGEKFIFSSDRTGVYNLYEVDLKSKTIKQMTNLIGGAFSSDISPDGKEIAFSSYGEKGFDLATMKYPAKFYGSKKIKLRNMSSDFFDKTSSEESNQPEFKTKTQNLHSDYTPFKTLLPHFWIPGFYSNELYDNKYETRFSFLTAGTDALDNHFYSMSADYGTVDKRIKLNINYTLSYFSYTDIFINYYNSDLYIDDDFPWDYKGNGTVSKESEENLTAGIALPWIKFDFQHYLNIYYSYDRDHYYYYNNSMGVSENQFKSARMGFYYQFNTTRSFINSIRPEKGINFIIKADLYDDRLGSDIEYQKGWTWLDISLPGFGDNHVLYSSIRGGTIRNHPNGKAPYTPGRFALGEKGTPANMDERLGIKGFPAGVNYFENIAAGSLEYSIPLIKKDVGYSTWPILFRNMYINIFGEAGSAWNEKENANRVKYSGGVELHSTFTIGYYLDLSAYIGYAKGLNYDGEQQVYFAISTFYEGTFNNKIQKKLRNSRF